MKRIISVLFVLSLLVVDTFAQETYRPPEYLSSQYPKRVSKTEIEYTPWFSLFTRSTAQSLQHDIVQGENCQVVDTLSFSDANPNHVIAGFDTNGIAISTDGGNNWFYQTSDLGTHACKTAFWHPTDENIVYKVSNAYNGSRYRKIALEHAENRGLFRSVDCGKTWERILDKTMHTEYGGTTAKFDALGRLYALTDEGLFRSEDDGDTWQQLNKLESWVGYDIAISSDGKTILTANVNGVTVSEDDGKTWSFRNGKQFYGNATSVDIDPLDEKHWIAAFYRPYYTFAETYDGGKTWNGIESPQSRPFKIKFGGIRDDGSRYMYAVGYDGASAYRYSKDSGATWLNALVDTSNSSPNNGTQIEGLALSRKHPDIVWYAFGDGLNVSYDGGVHFYNKSAGHGGQKCYTKMVTDIEGKLHFPGTDTGYFHTDTPYVSGESLPPCTLQHRMWGSAIAISPHNPKFMILGGGEQGDKVLYYSYDMGENWREIISTKSTTTYSLVEFHKTDRNVIYTNQSTSYDAGRTWIPNKTSISAVSPVNSDILFNTVRLGQTTVVKISRDRGVTWEDYIELNGLFSVKPDLFDSGKIWLTTVISSSMMFNDNIEVKLLSYDGKELSNIYTFNDLVDGNCQIDCFAQDPKNEKHLLIGLGKTLMDIGYGIAESYDGGESWVIVPGMPGNGYITMICFEERTNDIFFNGYVGIGRYDSEKFRKYHYHEFN